MDHSWKMFKSPHPGTQGAHLQMSKINLRQNYCVCRQNVAVKQCGGLSLSDVSAVSFSSDPKYEVTIKNITFSNKKTWVWIT